MIFVINFLLAIATTVGMTVIPFLVTDSLGLSLVVLGFLEGTTEFLSSMLRVTNGLLFDKVKNKRMIFVFSTALAVCAKAVLLIPSSIAVFASKMFERMANGAFASPRDAYVAEHFKSRGFALGLLGMSKSAGCILGPLLVSGYTIFVGNLRENIQLLIVFCFLLVLPAFFMSFGLNLKRIPKTEFSWKEVLSIVRKLRPILLISFLFFLGRFNDGLLLIYLKDKGFPEWFYLATISVFNAVMLISAPLIGWLIDRGRMRASFYLSIGSLSVFGVCFYLLEHLAWIPAIIGLISWGVQRTGAQIVFSFMIFKNVGEANFGTAIGIFHLVSGFGMMLSAFFCGFLTQGYFGYVFVLSLVCSLGALLLSNRILRNQGVLGRG